MTTADPKKERRKPQRITREMPSVGSEFVGRFRGREYRAAVIEAPSFPGGKAIKVGDTIHSSLSGAAKAVTGWPTNGWLFWKLR